MVQLILRAASGENCRLPLFALVLVVLAGCGDSEPGTPAVLTDLQVQGVTEVLNPAFDPDIFRYSIIADDQGTPLTITPFADPNVSITLDGSPTSSGTAHTMAALVAGDSIAIEVQYLPSDFPALSVTVRENDVSSKPLYVNLNGSDSNFIAILDNNGVPFFYQRDDQVVLDFKRHAATGERSYARFTGDTNQWGRRNSERVILDANFNEVERVTTANLSHTDHHDFLLLPGGEMVFIAYDGRLRDLSAYGLSTEELVEDSVIQVVERATNQVLFEWNSWDQLMYDEQLFPTTRREYAHVNSVFEDTDGNFIISARGTSQVAKISRPGGQVLWKLGGKSNQFSFTNDPFSQICGQHAVTRLSNGNLLIFDNGQNCWPALDERGDLTRIIEYKIDEQSLEAELVWSYTQDGAYSDAQGSAQRLSNGNTLIGWGRGPGIIATEVRNDGTKVFELVANDGDGSVISYRALRFPE